LGEILLPKRKTTPRRGKGSQGDPDSGAGRAGGGEDSDRLPPSRKNSLPSKGLLEWRKEVTPTWDKAN